MARRNHTVLDQCHPSKRWPVFAWVRCGQCGDHVRREWVWVAPYRPLPLPFSYDVKYGCWRCFESRVAFATWIVERGWRTPRPPAPPAPPKSGGVPA